MPRVRVRDRDRRGLQPKSKAAATLSGAECFLSGQVCSSLTRIVVPRRRHDERVESLAGTSSQVKLGDQCDANVQMGRPAMQRRRDRVESYIEIGKNEGATLATGAGRRRGVHERRGPGP